ncbi:MAG TPA: NYN domain-containing protein [Alphaproteobacteria bacterium]|nr:NYN domain-containing protein [Alphaproteobacteria bacterium]
MIHYNSERMAIFIDGANLYAAARALGFDIDYRQMLKWVSTRGQLIRAFYYTALLEDQEYSPIRPLVDWLDYNGFTMVTKPTKEFTDSYGRRKIKGNMDIELAIDVMEAANYCQHIMLFSGDGDFRRLIEAVGRKGVRTTVVSTMKSNPPMVADELRRQADNFLDLADIAQHFQRSYSGGRDEAAGEEPMPRTASAAPAATTRTGTTTAGPVTPQSVLAQQSTAVALDEDENESEASAPKRRGRPAAEKAGAA